MAKKYRSVVTGACGFIGSHMVEVLSEGGHEVIATDTCSALEGKGKIQKMCVDIVRQRAGAVIPADITEPWAMDRVVRAADFVFHTAGIFSYSAPWRLLYRVNVEGTANLIRAIERSDNPVRRLVIWGAGGVYGIPHKENIPFEEGTPPNPPNEYLRSKWFQEFMVMDRCPRSKIRFTILRPTTVYGPRQAYGVPFLFRSAYRSKVLAIPGNLTGRVPLVHVRDVCGAALHLSGSPSATNEVFNVNDDSQMTTVEIFRFLAQIFGKPFLKLPPVPIEPVKRVLKVAALVEGFVSKKVGRTPLMEKDLVNLFGADFAYSNKKLKSTGYRFRYPDPKLALIDTAMWYVKNGLL